MGEIPSIDQVIPNPASDGETAGSSSSGGGGAGIDCDSDSLTTGQCSLNITNTLGINPPNETPKDFLTDLVTGLTIFSGTVVTIGLIVSGLMLVAAGGNEALGDRGKKGIKYSLIGLLLVLFSYLIIQLVQRFAKGEI